MSSIEARHLVITGLVQGVGYRYSMEARANSLGVSGWVRNRRDGSVEALIIGDNEQLAAMLNWARHGPAQADVAKVEVEFAPLPETQSETNSFVSLPTI